MRLLASWWKVNIVPSGLVDKVGGDTVEARELEPVLMFRDYLAILLEGKGILSRV
jgi:hypothetical protein